MPKNLKLSLLALSVVLILCVFLGVNAHSVSAAAGTDQQSGAYKQINVYSEVLQHIQTDYVEDPNMSAVTAGALRGLLESLDADSSYLSPADYKAYQADRGGKAQVGIDVSKRYGYAVVVSVIPNSPADRAGLGDGDIIQAIGAQDTRDLSLAMIQKLLEGSPGSDLTLAVVRPRKATPDKLTLTRAMIAEPPVSETLLDNGSILDLKPASLDREHVDAVEAKLKAQEKGSEKKVVLDLRDVSTGDMAQGIRLANFFLRSGTIASLEGQKVAKETFTAEPGKALDPSAPLVVLTNHGTAGPAELVAAAIEDNKRGAVVGEKTFGEGAQQKLFNLPDGGAVILSIAKYESPAGKAYEDDGITPTVMVADATDLDDDSGDGAAGREHKAGQPDDQLNKALEILKAKAA